MSFMIRREDVNDFSDGTPQRNNKIKFKHFLTEVIASGVSFSGDGSGRLIVGVCVCVCVLSLIHI